MPNEQQNSDLKNRKIEVTAMTYPSVEYDTEPEEVNGTLFTRESPFGKRPQCYINGIQVDPSTVKQVDEDEDEEELEEGDEDE